DDESSNDDDNDDDVEKDEEDKEEEEHLAPANPIYRLSCPLKLRIQRHLRLMKNARNKRKWGSNHDESLSQQNKGHK
nr:hypothetical protein [Tanacetum cinerariifolium]